MIRIFNHYVPPAVILLLALEATLFVLAIFLGVYLRFLELSPTGSVLQPWLPQAFLYSFVMISVMTAFGLYEFESRDEVWQIVLRVSSAFMVGLIVMTLFFYVFPALSIGRGVLAISFLISLSGVIVLRLAFLQWTHLGIMKPRLLILGTGTRAAKIHSVLTPDGGRLNIVGYLPLGGTHHYVDQSKILTDTGPLSDIVTKYRVDEIVLAVRDRRGALPVDELLECKLKGVRIIELSTFFERERGRVQLESLNPSWMILSEGFRFGLYRDAVKRVFDVGASAVLLLLTLPIMGLTALLILLESGGPILYRQERVGQGGAIFTMLKFRSMTVNAEQDGRPLWAAPNDARVTRVGRIIRKLRIDELPQVFNVFMGTMSFVGPRPERAFFVSQLIAEIPYYSARHTVKPGITGWSQIKYPYGASIDDAIQKLQYDLYYIKNHGLFLDLMILFQTARVILWGRGAR